MCARLCGGEVVTVPRDDALEIDVESTRRAIDSGTKAILCPRPTIRRGTSLRNLRCAASWTWESWSWWDETYYEFCGQTVLPLLDEYPNLIVLRTFSKWAGLAGLRIGLGVMHPDVARVMMSVKPPYNVNLAAEIALMASLEDRQGLNERVEA